MNLAYPCIYAGMNGSDRMHPRHDAGQLMRPVHSGGPLNPGGCALKRQLLEDYVERVQALAVESELLLAIDKNSGGDLTARWLRIEQVRIACEIARLALVNHSNEHGC
jgi:hypothetical protein